MVLRDLAAGKFSLREFWTRRARRIIPPLIPVLLVSLAIGWVLLMPREFLKFGTSLASQAIFGSNFHFLHNSGYFAAPAQTKLLLHTWSLSVEEQFYVVYPLVLLALMRLHRPIWLLGLLLLVSLGVSIQLSLSNPAAAFYLPHSRAWELLLGAAIAFYVAYEHHWHPPALAARTAGFRRPHLHVGRNDVVRPQYPLPRCSRPAALSGCCRFHLRQYPHTYLRRAGLSIRPVVYLGLASYALYLWHWPLLVYARATPSGLAVWVAALTAFLLSVLSFHLLEDPIRKRRMFASNRTMIQLALASMIGIAVAGKAIAIDKGMLARFSPKAVALYTESQRKYPGCSPHVSPKQ